jgi:hypothetical protein
VAALTAGALLCDRQRLLATPLVALAWTTLCAVYKICFVPSGQDRAKTLVSVYQPMCK